MFGEDLYSIEKKVKDTPLKKEYLEFRFQALQDSVFLSLSLGFLLTAKFLRIIKRDSDCNILIQYFTRTAVDLGVEAANYISEITDKIKVKPSKKSIYDVCDDDFKICNHKNITILSNISRLKLTKSIEPKKLITKDLLEILLTQLAGEYTVCFKFIYNKISHKILPPDCREAPWIKIRLNEENHYSLIISNELTIALEDHQYRPYLSKIFYRNYSSVILEQFSNLNLVNTQSDQLFNVIIENSIFGSFPSLIKAINKCNNKSTCYLCGDNSPCDCHHNTPRKPCFKSCNEKMKLTSKSCIICSINDFNMIITYKHCGHSIHMLCQTAKTCPCTAVKCLEIL